jgi:predicted metal-dependent hydrolase
MQPGLPFDTSSEPASSSAPDAAVPQCHPELNLHFVRHRRARRYIVRVDLDGRVRVTIPRGGSRSEADKFALKHLAWIREEQRRRVTRTVDVADVHRLREVARRELPLRLRTLAAQHGVTVSRVSVRDQLTRWGSCGRDGHICLNWRLMQMPMWVSDYVMIHELMHLRCMDHSRRYWAFVAAAYPEYQDARRWLRAHGHDLM